MNLSKNIINRKDFLKNTCSATLLTALGFPLFSCNVTSSGDDDTKNRILDSSAEGIRVEGDQIIIDLHSATGLLISDELGWLLIRDKRTLVLNTDGNLFRSFTSVCTHANCSTNWRFQNRQFECTCHGSRFDMTGAAVRGPATRALTEFTVIREDNFIIVKPNHD